MKRLLITLTFTILFTSTYGQDKEADVSPYGFLQKELFIEGNIQYSSVDNQTIMNKTTSLGFNPKIGYFLFDDFALGIQASYQIDNSTNTIVNADTEIIRKVESTYYSPGIFARYYFLQFGKRFFTYGELGGNYGVNKSFTDIDGEVEDEVKTNLIEANLSLGLNYFVNDKIIISFSLADVISYSSEKLDADDAKPTNTLNANINILSNFFQTAQFGVMFILN